MSIKRCYGYFCIKFVLIIACEGVLPKNPCLEGYILPQGDDITLEYGNPLDLTCILVKTTYKNASLSFTKNGVMIPSEMINVINSTVIKLHTEKPPLVSGDLYTCLLDNQTNLCMKRLSVGTEPQKVTDFSCISYNYDNLTCTWTAPQNFVPTDYNLTLTLGKGTAARYTYPCPSILSDASRKYCFWNESTTPRYRVLRGKYNNFTLKMKNIFGQNQINKVFNHFAHVVPGPPENLIAETTTPSSVYLSWHVPTSMQTFPPGVHHRILYQCECGKKQWNYGGMLTVKAPRRKAYFNLTNLPCAYALCDIRVSLRSAKALLSDESRWSPNTSITVRTSSKIPDEPPLTNVGSFEVVSDYKDIYIYWKQIREEQKNGPSFRYEIKCVDNVFRCSPREVTNTYAKFPGYLLLFDSLTFHILSKNVNRSSFRTSIVNVPFDNHLVNKPRNLTKVEFGDGDFELTWEPPLLPENQYITNYTVFSCYDKIDRPHQCNGSLNWTIVSNETTSINMKVDKNKVFQFAISANTEHSSSGMLWADCTITHNRYMSKLKNVWTKTSGTRSIEVHWQLICTDKINSVEGYIIYYCPVTSSSHTECTAPQANTTFYGNTISSGNITDLNPSTTYMLTICVITKHNTFSQLSDPRYHTTQADSRAPSPPQNFTVVNVTSSTVTLSWQPPEGELELYRIGIWPIYLIEDVRNDSTSFTFEQLRPNEEYQILLVACTKKCSEEVKTKVLTPIGRPNRIAKPRIIRRSGSSITIIWKKPSKPGGNNDFYIVQVRSADNSKTFEYTTTGRTYVLDKCLEGGTFYVSVKAVNKNQGTYFYGPWSKELKNECSTPPMDYMMYLLPVFAIATLLTIGFLIPRLVHYFMAMKNVGVELPPGLASVVTNPTFVPWTSEEQQENCASHSPLTEHLPPTKIKLGPNMSSSSDPGTIQPGY